MPQRCLNFERFKSCENCPHCCRPTCHQAHTELELGLGTLDDADLAWAVFFDYAEDSAAWGDREPDLMVLLGRIHQAFASGGVAARESQQIETDGDAISAVRCRQEAQAARQKEIARAVVKALQSQGVPSHRHLVYRIVCDIAPSLRASPAEVYHVLSTERATFRTIRPRSGVYELIRGSDHVK